MTHHLAESMGNATELAFWVMVTTGIACVTVIGAACAVWTVVEIAKHIRRNLDW